MELIKALGLNWPTLISQLINFAILYFLLKKFALTSLMENITNRQQQIEQGLRNAQFADKALQEAKAQEEQIVNQARVEAQDIINTARQNANEQSQQIIEQAKTQAEEIITDGHKQVALSKDKMMREVKKELADVIAIGVEKLVGAKVSAQDITSDYLQTGLEA